MMSFSWIMAYIILLLCLMKFESGGKVCCVCYTIVELIMMRVRFMLVNIIKNGNDVFDWLKNVNNSNR